MVRSQPQPMPPDSIRTHMFHETYGLDFDLSVLQPQVEGLAAPFLDACRQHDQTALRCQNPAFLRHRRQRPTVAQGIAIAGGQILRKE